MLDEDRYKFIRMNELNLEYMTMITKVFNRKKEGIDHHRMNSLAEELFELKRDIDALEESTMYEIVNDDRSESNDQELNQVLQNIKSTLDQFEKMNSADF